MVQTLFKLPAEFPIVFVVDDDPAVRQSVCWLVESGGRRVAAFDTAQAFLDSYTPDQAGCVVTDIRMPGMSGLQLQEELADQGYTIPVIIMTAYGDVTTAVRAMKAGAIDFLEKPYNDHVLLDLIEEAIEKDGDIRRKHMQSAAARAKFDLLTPREQQVMKLIVQGRSNKSMASELEITTKTIEAHRAKVMEKMETGSVAELTRLAALCV
jgi:FixJ family two-component response regulator